MRRCCRLLIGLGAFLLGALALLRWLWFRQTRLDQGMKVTVLASASHGPAIAMARLATGHARAVIIAHGLLKSMRLPGLVSLAKLLAEDFDVLMFDFAGHGQSAGQASLDLQAAAEDLSKVVQRARALGYEQVGVVGFSMGAAAAIIARSDGCPIDVIVSISSPVAPQGPQTPYFRSSPAARAFAALMGTRLAREWPASDWPVQRIAGVNATPLLVVHNGWDTLIAREDSEALFALANPPKDYLYVPRRLHASPLAAADAIRTWLEDHLS